MGVGGVLCHLSRDGMPVWPYGRYVGRARMVTACTNPERVIKSHVKLSTYFMLVPDSISILYPTPCTIAVTTNLVPLARTESF